MEVEPLHVTTVSEAMNIVWSGYEYDAAAEAQTISGLGQIQQSDGEKFNESLVGGESG